jgi:hypothetical protein
MRFAVAWCVISLLCATAPRGGDGDGSYRVRPFGLADVRRIYIARLGSGETGAATREALIGALRTVGFEPVEHAEQADAIMSGIVETKVVMGEPVVVFKSAVLRAHSGETLWYARLRSARSPHKQAGRMARALRASVERAVWEAAREVP